MALYHYVSYYCIILKHISIHFYFSAFRYIALIIEDIFPLFQPSQLIHLSSSILHINKKASMSSFQRGANNEPQNATIMIAFIAMLFILIGKLNTLATIATMPFLLTYITINYAYFALAMSYDLKQQQKQDELQQKNKDIQFHWHIKKRPDEVLVLQGNEVKETEKTPLIDQCPSYGSQEAEQEVNAEESQVGS